MAVFSFWVTFSSLFCFLVRFNFWFSISYSVLDFIFGVRFHFRFVYSFFFRVLCSLCCFIFGCVCTFFFLFRFLGWWTAGPRLAWEEF